MGNCSVANIYATDWFLKARGDIYLFPGKFYEFPRFDGLLWVDWGSRYPVAMVIDTILKIVFSRKV